MKQAKLSFLRTSKRKAETIDPGPKSKRVKEATPAVSKKTEPETRETSKKKNVVQQLELMNNNKNETRFSDSMKDAVKTLCKICNEAVTLTSMRGHTKSKHGIPIADYKNTHGNHRDQIIEKIYHKCGLCQQALLLDSDEIAGHLKSKHEITHKDYNSRFMNLIKEEKEKAGSKVVKSKANNNVKKCAKKSSEPSIEKTEKETPVKDVLKDDEKISSSFENNVLTRGCVNVEKRNIEYEDFEAGPSSGQRLTEKERSENLAILFTLQRILLKKRCNDNEDDDDEPEFSTRAI